MKREIFFIRKNKNWKTGNSPFPSLHCCDKMNTTTTT